MQLNNYLRGGSNSSLNSMHIQNAERIERIHGLPLRPEIRQMLTGQLQLGPFQEYFGEPSHFYAQGYPDRPGSWPIFADRQLLPLWQHHEKIYAMDLSVHPPELISWYIDCPDDFTTIPSVDAAVFDMIELHVWDYGCEEQQAVEAIHFAKQIALPHTERLCDLLQNCERCSAESIAEYRQSL